MKCAGAHDIRDYTQKGEWGMKIRWQFTWMAIVVTLILVPAWAGRAAVVPENEGMRAGLAWELLNQGKPAEAVPIFEELTDRHPMYREAYVGLAVAYLRLGNPRRAVVALDRGLNRFPGDPLLLKLKGEAWLSRGETAAKAVAVFASLAARQPEKAEWARRHREAALLAARQSYREAQEFLRTGDKLHALRALQRAVAFAPENPGYRTHFGWVLLESNDYYEAALNFKEALDRDPQKQDAYLGLVFARLGLGDATGAMAAARQGLAVFPEDSQLLEALGDAAAKNPETQDSAVDSYRRLLAQGSASPAISLKLAQVLFAAGRLNEAEEAYTVALAAEPANVQAQLDLGRMNLMADAYGQAAAHYREALTVAPDNREAQQGLQEAITGMRPQIHNSGGVFEDSDTFRGWHLFSGLRWYLTPLLKAYMGYGYFSYSMSNDPKAGRLLERTAHRNVLPLLFQYRPDRRLLFEVGGAFSDYGTWGQSGSARAGAYWQATPQTGVSLSYTYHDVIDYYGPFMGPWGQSDEVFADMKRYRYLVIDPVAVYTHNIFGPSSTQAITHQLRAHEVAFWGYQNLFTRLTLSLYGSISPYSDGNFNKTSGATVTWRVLDDPLLKAKYSFFYTGFRQYSAALAGLPPGSWPLYWDPIAFKNHSLGVVLEKNWGGWLKFAMESDMLFNAGADQPGVLALAEVTVLLTDRLALRGVGSYMNSVDSGPQRTSYQVRNIFALLTFRF